MELRHYFELIRRRLLLVIVAVLVGGVGGYVSTSRTPVYSATATIYVGQYNISADQAQLALQSGLNEVVATFASMIPSAVIAQHALDKDHLDRQAGAVAANTTSVVVPGTDLIDVTVSDSNGPIAVQLANGMANAFVSQIAHYQTSTPASGTGGTSTQGAVPNEPAYVFQSATAASESSDGLTRKILVGALLGLVVAIAVVFLLDYLDITIKSPEELERRLDLPVLGVIPLFGTLRLGARSATRGDGRG